MALHPLGARVLSGELVAVFAMGLSLLPLAALAHHVGCVVRVRSEKQMRGPAATPIVAVVADQQTVRDRPVRQLPGYAMSNALKALSVYGFYETTVALIRTMPDRSLPFPAAALVAAINLRPEALWHRWPARHLQNSAGNEAVRDGDYGPRHYCQTYSNRSTEAERRLDLYIPRWTVEAADLRKRPLGEHCPKLLDRDRT
jgi:hypothetical protein